MIIDDGATTEHRLRWTQYFNMVWPQSRDYNILLLVCLEHDMDKALYALD